MAQSGLSLIDKEDCLVVKIEGSARVEAAVLLKEKLAKTKFAHEVVIDWGEAEHVDASVLQVLLALRQTLAEQGLSFLVDIDNSKVRQYLNLSGLSEYFPLRSQPPNPPMPEGGHA